MERWKSWTLVQNIDLLYLVFPLGYKRSSDNDPKEADESQKDKVASMTEEEKEYLRWYYRTEDRKCNLILVKDTVD